jgi:DUF177 domain-containing protein
MPARADTFDLGGLKLSPGEGRRLDLEVQLGDFDFSDERYATPATVPVRLDVSRMVGGGYSLRLRFESQISGPCMRCLEAAAPVTEVDAREVDQPGGGEELTSPYVDGDELDLRAWARDAYALALPAQVLCRPECLGLCPQCGANLNAEPDHVHEAAPDSRWAKLRELKLE